MEKIKLQIRVVTLPKTMDVVNQASQCKRQVKFVIKIWILPCVQGGSSRNPQLGVEFFTRWGPPTSGGVMWNPSLYTQQNPKNLDIFQLDQTRQDLL